MLCAFGSSISNKGSSAGCSVCLAYTLVKASKLCCVICVLHSVDWLKISECMKYKLSFVTYV